ncbi:hypothetical protein [Streptomyces sp. NPDC056549]|uniref:hypothetical protein n=1 Tax=Streptomyces sp. NPDC056549 TaxID=3345864 RepID=UPI0036A942D0
MPAPAAARPTRTEARDPRRWLEDTRRLDTGRLALACALSGYDEHMAAIEQAAVLTLRARLRAQMLFLYGLGPVLGDLMLPADGGGDMLHALSDVVESLFARRRLPYTYPFCPWGSTDGLGCGRDSFGRLLHDHCRTRGPVPDWCAKSWAVWTWRTARALDSLAPHLIEHQPPQSVDMRAPGRIEKGSQIRRVPRPATIGVGDRVRFAGQVRAVLAVSARAVTLADEDDSPRDVPLAVLLGDENFEVLDSAVRLPPLPVSLLEALPEHAREKALWWEGHILEVLHGVDPNADEDAGPRPEYDPARHSLTARERAKRPS